MILTREQILSASDIKTEVVPVPEWGGDVMIRGLTGADRDSYEQDITTIKGKNTRVNWINARAKFVALSIVDESGQRIFEDTDIKALGNKSAAALDRVFQAAQKLSGLTDEDVDELTKN